MVISVGTWTFDFRTNEPMNLSREGRSRDDSVVESCGGVWGGDGGSRLDCTEVASHWMTSDALVAR